MAIKIKNLEKISNTYAETRFVYKDLALDLSLTKIEAPGYDLPIPGSDIQASFDIGAIRNSLQNLFGTYPGQRFLFPEYGLNLQPWLFSPLTESNGNSLGLEIFSTIARWETRISVKNVYVTVDPDNYQYIINIIMDIPAFNITETIKSVLDVRKQSFQVLPTSKTSKFI